MTDPITAANQARANRAAASPWSTSDLATRLRRAEWVLADMADDYDQRGIDSTRLQGKAEGVRLALSYVTEVVHSRPARTFTNPARTVVVTVHDAEGVAEIAYREGDSFGPPVELSEEI